MEDILSGIERHGWTVVFLVLALIVIIDEWKKKRR